MTFAEKLRNLRDERKLTEAEIAKMCGESYAAMHSYFAGVRKPSFVKVVKIAKALGTDCTAFAECTDVSGSKKSKPKKPKPAKRKPG